jgi:cellulose synthase/poly-beta-1,6-N-acetylglucosamine synthase-like glycosyltransferase
MSWFEPVAWVIVVALAVPLVVLAVECLAGFRRWVPQTTPESSTRPRSVVLIPAHDEELGIAPTLKAVVEQLGPADRVLVVADNCTDGTAALARSHGAEVVERFDDARRGKGYALAFGRDAMRVAPPDVVIVLDADCTLGDHTLLRLASEVAASGRPAQAANRLSAPPQAGPDRRVAAFAFLIKNFVRPLGLRRLGGHCILTGTGMAFPWAVFRDAPLDDGHIAEDLGLSVELARRGTTASFVPDAEVRGEFPVDDRAADSQRKRWEHGHLRVITRAVPRLGWAAVTRGRFNLLVMALDVGVPPLSALALAVVVAITALGVWAFFGGPLAPAVTLAAVGALAAGSIAAAWVRYGRALLPPGFVIRVPVYVVRKVALYAAFVIRPQRAWVRTSRETDPAR